MARQHETVSARPATTTTDARSDTAHRDDIHIEVASNGHAVCAAIVGMLAATFGFLVVSAPAAIIFGIAGIVLGVMGMRYATDHGGLLKGTAITGLVSGVLGLLLGLAVVIGGVTLFQELEDDAAVQSQIDRLQEEVDRLTVPEVEAGS